jgi:hypothetical protein
MLKIQMLGNVKCHTREEFARESLKALMVVGWDDGEGPVETLESDPAKKHWIRMSYGVTTLGPGDADPTKDVRTIPTGLIG